VTCTQNAPTVVLITAAYAMGASVIVVAAFYGLYRLVTRLRGETA